MKTPDQNELNHLYCEIYRPRFKSGPEMTLNELFQQTRDRSATIFATLGRVQPVMIADMPDSENLAATVMPYWNSHDDRLRIAAVYRAMFKQFNVQRYAMVNEVWISAAPKTKILDINKVPLPSQDPNRKEAVMILAEERGGKCLAGMFPIIRKVNSRVQLGPFDQGDDNGFENFTFDNMFSDERTMN